MGIGCDGVESDWQIEVEARCYADGGGGRVGEAG